jgi:hypothetical protein
VTDIEQKAYWHTMLYPHVGLFSLDVRLQRSLHRHQLLDLDWKDHEYLGPVQMEDLKVQNFLCPSTKFLLKVKGS